MTKREQLTDLEFSRKVEDFIKDLKEKEEQERLVVIEGIKRLQDTNGNIPKKKTD